MPGAPPVVSNDDFLTACFGAAAPSAHVTAFMCDPNEAKQQWAGLRWKMADAAARVRFASQNCYFAISTFADDATGRASRTKDLFEATQVIVVDDVGTKVDAAAEAILPGPSWMLETSPGNFQWGYILATPEPNAGRVNALLDGLVAKGLCLDGKDPGMKGVTRYVRMPQGRNTKAKYGRAGFQCRLTTWHPDRRFTLDNLARPFGVALPAPGTANVRTRQFGPVDPTGDVMFDLLNKWGLVKNPTAADGSGYDIECPWLDEHTDRADSGSAYWPGSGGFKCHHGHCETKGRQDLRAWADAHLRAENSNRFGLAGLDFKDADKPLLDRVWGVLAVGGAITSGDMQALARAPGRGVVNMLGAARAILGSDTKTIASTIRTFQRRDLKAAKAAARHTAKQAGGKARAKLGTPVALPFDILPPVSLAEAQAQNRHWLQSAFGIQAQVAVQLWEVVRHQRTMPWTLPTTISFRRRALGCGTPSVRAKHGTWFRW